MININLIILHLNIYLHSLFFTLLINMHHIKSLVCLLKLHNSNGCIL